MYKEKKETVSIYPIKLKNSIAEIDSLLIQANERELGIIYQFIISILCKKEG